MSWTGLIPILSKEVPFQNEFHYDKSYLSDSQAFTLDSHTLPLRPAVHAAIRPAQGVPALFEDSAPDDWGCT